MDVRARLREHLDYLFHGAPRTRAVYELQEELMANSLERYDDLRRSGMDEESALQNVMGSIGNVDELLAALPAEDRMEAFEYEEDRRAKSAVNVAIAVGLYILAGVVFFISIFLSSVLWDNFILLGLALAALICIVPTVMLVYNAYRYPSYKKAEESVVEDFKEWNSNSKKQKSLRGAVSSLLWSFTVVIYLLVSFFSFQWWITWIIFPIAACIEAAITLIFRMKELR